jgi:hypothetical protein
MKTLINILFLSFALSATAQQNQAQDRGRHERVESFRIAYITEHLKLTPEEAQRFWPVYNAYRGDMKTLRKNFKADDKDGTPLTADQQLEFEQKKLDLKKRFKPQFEQAIGKEKLNLLMQVEEDFKRELMKAMQERRGR